MRHSTWIAGLAFFMVSGAAGAAWAVYERPELGYRLDFPDTPAETNGVYRSILVQRAPTHIVTAQTDTGVFTATVVDLFDRAEDSASLMNEAEFFLNLLGDVVDISTTRTPPGERAVFGRHITIDMRSGRADEQIGQTEAAHKLFKDATGLDVVDGARMTTHMYFRNGRFYIFHGVNLPVDGDARSPDALRFLLSFVWTDLDE